MKRILVGVDGSSQSMAALRYGIGLARSMGAEVELLHASEPKPIQSRAMSISPGGVREAEQMLAAAAHEHRQHGSALVTQVVVGAAGEALARAAMSPEIGLIVVGTRGRGQATTALFGGTVQHLIEHSEKPVIIVKRDAPAPGLDVSILVGVDGSPESHDAAHEAAALAMATGARLRLAYVEPFFADGLQRRFEADVLREAAARESRAALTIETMILRGSPADALSEAARAPAVVLIAVGHREKSALSRFLFGGTSDRLARIADVPVLVVR